MVGLACFAATGSVAQPAQATSAGASAIAKIDTKATIDEIIVEGNTLLPPQQLDAALARFKGQRSVAELQQAAAQVQAEYLRAGYGGVVAFLPEQSLTGARLRITVIEGRLTHVVVTGNKNFSEQNIVRSVPALRAGTTPRIAEIDAQIQLANDNPSKRIALTLEEGSNRGEIDARINVSEQPASTLTFAADNTGDQRTGRMRLSAAYQNSALWDLDHQLTLQVQVSPQRLEAVRVINAGYKLPLYGSGLMLHAYASSSNVNAGITPTVAGNLQFNGNGRIAGARITRLFVRLGEFEQRASLAIDQRDYLNNCAIDGLPPGACGPSGESVTVQPLTVGYALQRQGSRPTAVTLEYSTNLALGGNRASASSFNAVRPGAERGYGLWRLNAFTVLPLAADWQSQFRLALQASRQHLVPGEQFSPSGAGAVRGYGEREISGDQGAVGTIELLSPTLLAPKLANASGFSGMRLLAFADAGYASNHGALACNGRDTGCAVSSIGIGARFGFGQSSWKFDLARASTDARTSRKGDLKLHFAASLTLQ